MSGFEYPRRTINLFRHEVLPSNAKVRKRWSIDSSSAPKVVEEAARDYFYSDGWLSSRNASDLISLMFNLQILATGELSEDDFNSIANSKINNLRIDDTFPIIPVIGKRKMLTGWLDSRIKSDSKFYSQMQEIFPETKKLFSPRNLVFSIIRRIDRNFETSEEYQTAISDFIDNLPFHRNIKHELRSFSGAYTSNFSDEDIKSGSRYHSFSSGKTDFSSYKEKMSLADPAQIDAVLPTALHAYYIRWRNEKAHGIKHGLDWGAKPINDNISDIKNWSVLSEESFGEYLVKNSRDRNEVCSGLLNLYKSFPRNGWHNLSKSMLRRDGDFYHEAGIPDLLIWNGTDYQFTEIKTKNDKLQSSQVDYIEGILKPLSLNYSICDVQEASVEAP